WMTAPATPRARACDGMVGITNNPPAAVRTTTLTTLIRKLNLWVMSFLSPLCYARFELPCLLSLVRQACAVCQRADIQPFQRQPGFRPCLQVGRLQCSRLFG